MQGFYVNVDYHSNNYTNDVANGDGSIFDKPTWTQTWTYLLETIVKSVPQAQGRLLIDLINEPDGYVRAHTQPSLTLWQVHALTGRKCQRSLWTRLPADAAVLPAALA